MVEGPERVDGQVDRGGGKVAPGDKVQYPMTSLGLPELVRRALVELGQIICPAGMLREALAQRAYPPLRSARVVVGGCGGTND